MFTEEEFYQTFKYTKGKQSEVVKKLMTCWNDIIGTNYSIKDGYIVVDDDIFLKMLSNEVIEKYHLSQPLCLYHNKYKHEGLTIQKREDYYVGHYPNKNRDFYNVTCYIIPSKKYQNILDNRKKREDRLKEIIEENSKKVKDNKKYKDACVYGIKIDGELVYIGKTIRPLQERIKEHIEQVLNPNLSNSQQLYLYNAMRNAVYGYKFEVLAKPTKLCTNREIEEVEKKFIEAYQPKYNYEGVKVPYRFSNEK